MSNMSLKGNALSFLCTEINGRERSKRKFYSLKTGIIVKHFAAYK